VFHLKLFYRGCHEDIISRRCRGGVGIWELLVILGIVVILFGAKRLPMIGEGLGGMITSFKKATKKENNESPAVQDTVSMVEDGKKEAS
jgi:sec-independent protein translocase protein TatA